MRDDAQLESSTLAGRAGMIHMKTSEPYVAAEIKKEWERRKKEKVQPRWEIGAPAAPREEVCGGSAGVQLMCVVAGEEWEWVSLDERIGGASARGTRLNAWLLGVSRSRPTLMASSKAAVGGYFILSGLS